MSQQEADRRTGKRLWYALRWAFATSALAVLFYKVPLSKVIAAVTSADIGLLLAAWIAMLCTQLVSARRLKLLTDANGLDLTTYELFRINMASMFYGLFLPAGNFAGFAIRIYRLSRPRKQYVGSIVSILFDRIAATWALCSVGIIAWLLVAPRSTWPVLMLMIIALTGMTLLQAMFFVDWRSLLPGTVSRLLIRLIPVRLQPSPGAIARFRAMPRRVFVHVLLFSVLAQILGIAVYQLIAMALDLPVPVLTIVWVRSISMLASMLPVSIAGLGVRDATLLTLLAPLSVVDSHAIAYSMLIFAVTVLAVGITGGILDTMPAARRGEISA